MLLLLGEFILYIDISKVVSDSLSLTCLAALLAFIVLAFREPRRGDTYVITLSSHMTYGLTIEALYSVIIQGPTIEVGVIVGLIEFFVDSSVVEVLLEFHQEMLVQIDELLLLKLIVLIIDQ